MLPRRPVPIILTISLLVFISYVVVNLYQGDKRQVKKGEESKQAIYVRPLPEKRSQDYVGSESCKSCHEEIFATYVQTAMGSSMSLPDAPSEVSTPIARFSPAAGSQYEVRAGESLTHAEQIVDDQGNLLFEDVQKVSFVLGSGLRGKSYLVRHGDKLFQSPVGWYAQGDRWDLSPGYDPHHNPRFSRRVGQGCLYCHAGRTLALDGDPDRFQEPIFSELSIGCERCHGPGAAHVAYHEAASPKESGLHDDIVNPINLPPTKRDAVCSQCHIAADSVVPRAGRSFVDFRPGDYLEDVLVVLDKKEASQREMKSVNQVDQMEASVCFQASDGAMGCISCHDPHANPPQGDQAAYYRKRCYECHEENSCGIEAQERHLPPANNSCVHCHMPRAATNDVPHTAMTDHSIPRVAPKAGTSNRGSSTQYSLSRQPTMVVRPDRTERLPAWEIERAKGIMIMNYAWSLNNQSLANQAFEHFARSLPPGSPPLNEAVMVMQDVDLMNEIAACFFVLEERAIASRIWNRILEFKPEHEAALTGLAKLAEMNGNDEKLQTLVDQLMVAHPYSEDILSMAFRAAISAGKLEHAEQLASRILQINPNNSKASSWLITALEGSPDPNEAQRYLRLQEHFEKTSP